MNFYIVGDFSPSAHGEGLKKKKIVNYFWRPYYITPYDICHAFETEEFTSKN